jgi:hypothetical protein
MGASQAGTTVTAQARLARARSRLTLASVVRALVGGAAATVLLKSVMMLLQWLLNRSLLSSSALTTVGVLAGLLVLIVLLRQNRAVRSTTEVALWLEGRVPALRYSLVTLAERAGGDSAALEHSVAETVWSDPIRSSLARSVGVPLLLLGAACVVALLLPSWSAPGTRGAREARASETAPGQDADDPFHSFVVRVTPPAYSRLPVQRLDQPEAVTSLTGSAIQIEGEGWAISTRMPDSATPYWLERGGKRRLLVLLPVPDSVPDVELRSPARDSVVRSGSGAIVLAARARDDFGLEAGWFEYIVSSGEGENYTFRSGVVGRRTLSNAGGADLAARVLLDSLRLAPGNIVHLRAVAQDGNTVSGPGIAYSDTRTLRIPRPGEGDSVAVDQVARAEGDSSLLSQRMLVMMAEALERRRPRLRRDTFVSESRRIAGDQAALRRRVADIIFLRLGAEGSMEESEDSTSEPLTPQALLEAAEQATVSSGGEALDFRNDETPVVALNRPLLEAYNAMWEAGRALEIGEPRQALPHMREALEAIQRARQAERIYLRGRPATRVIDLSKIRLAGSLADAAPARTLAGGRDPGDRAALLARYSRAIELLPREAALDSLQLLRIDALETEPRFAAALGEAVAALRNGRDATPSLIGARRLLAGPLRQTPGLSPWDLAP